jgi:hypothetical protein
MRRGTSLLGLLLVAAALGGYIYFVELKRDPSSTAETKTEKVFTLTPGSIETVEITNAAAETTRVVRQDASWAITAPEATEADTVEVATVVSSLESLEQTRVVVEAPEALAPFGLDPARMSITFTVAGETTPRRLLLGNKTPTGGDIYAQVDGSPKVFLIGAFLEDTFNKSPFAFREKSVLKFARDAADALTITQGSSRLALSRSGNEWRLSAPLNARADFGAVDGIVSRLFQARMATLVTADGTKTLGTYGLDRPQVVVTVGSGSSTAELALGAAESETHVYARDLARPMVFTVEKALADELKKTPEDMRVKDLFAFRSFNATTVTITSAGTAFTFTKKAGEGENAADVWSLTTPTTRIVDAAKMTDLLTTTSNLRAESFAARALTSGEVVTVTVTFTDASSPTTETITFRKSGTVVQAIREGEPGAAVVSTVDFDRVISLLQEIAG